MNFKIIISLLLLTMPNCESMSERERSIISYPKEKEIVYEEYLVRLEQYTTNGDVYHKKYYKHLIGLARTIIEEKKYSISKNSIGFYHDKKKSAYSKLFLGFDINSGQDYNASQKYGQILSQYLQKDVPKIMPVLYSCKSIFAENDIAGMVIGFRWLRAGKQEGFNFWIESKDVSLFEEQKLTLGEIIERNTITDTGGIVIRLLK